MKDFSRKVFSLRGIVNKFSLLAVAALFLLMTSVSAQVSISTGTTVTQTFDSLGTAAAAPLPTGFKADKNTAIRTVGTYAAAGSATERLGGDALSTTAGNGIYNFGAGPAATATDRAIGFLASSSATTSGNLYVQLQNTGTTTITQLTISYDVEKYRNGLNAAGFTIQLYTSPDDVTYTAATGFTTSFAADATNTGFTPAPGATVPVTGTLNVSIAPGAFYYLAFNYSVTSGTVTSNAQALAIDNLRIQAPAATTAATVNVGGRVTDAKGRAISGAIVTMTDGDGENYSAVTDNLGNYRFEEVQVGQVLLFQVRAKRYYFTQPSQVVSLTDEEMTVDFRGYSARAF